MRSFLTKIAIGVAGLALAGAPLAASAQSWHGHDGDRGAYRDHDRGHDKNWDRGDDRWRDYDRGRDEHRDDYGRRIYRQPYANGYYGWAPGGFRGYFSNGGWYQHRRFSGGIWIYF